VSAKVTKVGNFDHAWAAAGLDAFGVQVELSFRRADPEQTIECSVNQPCSSAMTSASAISATLASGAIGMRSELTTACKLVAVS
jgi:hypothetical protein